MRDWFIFSLVYIQSNLTIFKNLHPVNSLFDLRTTGLSIAKSEVGIEFGQSQKKVLKNAGRQRVR